MKTIESRLLTAAPNMFKRFGFKKTSVDEIASAAGVAKSTLYQHYKSKQDLLLAVIIHELKAVREEVLENTNGIKSPVLRLRRMSELGLAFFRKKPLIARLLAEPIILMPNTGQADIIALAENEMNDIIQQIIETGQQEGDIRTFDARTIAYLLLKVFQSFTFARTGSLPFDETRQDREIEELMDMLTYGIAATDGRNGS